MFDNIGSKLKGCAKFFCWFGIILSGIGAIALWCINSRHEPTIVSGFIVLIVGVLASWVGSIGMYAFGELVENTADIKALLQQNPQYSVSKNRNTTTQRSATTNNPSSSHNSNSKTWICYACNHVNLGTTEYCKNCNTSKYGN